MGNLLRQFTRRYAGSLVLAVFLALGIGYFWLYYVPARTATLNNRYYRVLASIGADLTNRLEADIYRAGAGVVPAHYQQLEQLLRHENLPRREVFTYFAILEPPRSFAISAGPTDPESDWLLQYASPLAAPDRQQTKVPAEVELGGEQYQLFVLPVRLNARSTWLLCGAVPVAQLTHERHELPPNWSTTIMGLVLLGLLTLPFLKLALMSPREQLERADVVRCGVSLVLGSGILLLTVQSLLVHYLVERPGNQQQLTALADETAACLDKLPSWSAISSASPAARADTCQAAAQRQAATQTRAVQHYLQQQLGTPALPPGFGLAVADRTGQLVYQADTLLRHSENLLTDCQPHSGMAAAFLGRQPEPVRAVYQGHDTQLYVRPLAHTGYYVVAYVDMRYAKSHQFQAWAMALELLGGFWLCVLLFGLAHRLLVRRTDRWPVQRDTLRHFWPNHDYAFRYWQVLLGLAGGVLVLAIGFVRAQPPGQYYLLLVVPAQLYLLTFRYTRLRRASELESLSTTFGLVGGTLMLVSGIFGWYYSYWGLFALDCLQVGAGLLVRWLGRHPFWLHTRDWLQHARGVWLSWLLLVCGLLWWAGHYIEREATCLLLLRLALLLLLWGLWHKMWRRPLPAPDHPSRPLLKWLLWWPLRWYQSWFTRNSRRIYQFMLGGWIVLLGLVPALVCYRTGRLTERLYQVREAQLHLLDGQPQATSPLNSRFFYDSEVKSAAKPSSSLADSSLLADRAQHLLNPAATLRWLAWLHPNPEPLLASAAPVFNSPPADCPAAWWVSGLTLDSFWNSQDIGLQSWLGDLTSTSRIDTQGSHRLARYGLLLAGFLLGMYVLLRYLNLRVFSQVEAPPVWLPHQEHRPPALPTHRYWLLPGNSDWQDVPAWTKRMFLGVDIPPSDIIDCQVLFAPYSFPDQQANFPSRQAQVTRALPHAKSLDDLLNRHSSLSATTTPLVFTHFEYGSDRPAITALKCRLLDALLPLGRPLLLVANVHPMGFGNPTTRGPHAAPPATATTARAEPLSTKRDNRQQARHEHLLNLLGSFRLQYFSLRWLVIEQPLQPSSALPGLQLSLDFATPPAASPPLVPVAATDAVKHLTFAPGQTQLHPWTKQELTQVEVALFGPPDARRPERIVFEKECAAFPFVAAMRADILGALWRQRTESPELSHAQKEVRVAHKQQEAARHASLRSVRRVPSNLFRKQHWISAFNWRAKRAREEAERNAPTRADLSATERQYYPQAGHWQAPTREEIADTVRRLGWLYFRRIWRALSPQERFLLFDLAYDGLVNPDNRHLLHNLLHKGLLRLNQYGRLCIASEGFRAFIYADERQPEALRYAEQAPYNLWAVVQPPLVLLITVGALFVAATQPGPFLEPQRLLALAAALMPQLSFLLQAPRSLPSPTSE